MSILILTGPPAAGKNTVGLALAALLERSALVDVDQLRWMLRKPHVAPWLGEEGARQARLGIENACLLAGQFARSGCDVVVLDFLWDYSLPLYRARLPETPLLVVRLMPPKAVCIKRNQQRGQWLSDQEVAMLYASMEQFTGHDISMDTSALPAGEVARRLAKLMPLAGLPRDP